MQVPLFSVALFVLLYTMTEIILVTASAAVTKQPHETPETTIDPPRMRSITIPSLNSPQVVSGYVNDYFIHGEISLVNRQRNTIEGFVYHQNKKLYIYGELLDNQTISAYDQQGNHYLLQFE